MLLWFPSIYGLSITTKELFNTNQYGLATFTFLLDLFMIVATPSVLKDFSYFHSQEYKELKIHNSKIREPIRPISPIMKQHLTTNQIKSLSESYNRKIFKEISETN